MTKEISSIYDSKPKCYFTGARKSFVDDLPYDPGAKLLEIGCGNGDTAAYALKSGKCGWCAGIELCAKPAEEAKRRDPGAGHAPDVEHGGPPRALRCREIQVG